MKLSKMVEENITSEEVEIIEEKKKCKKKKALMEEGMKYCAKCGAEYSEELEACQKCEATETFSKCESIELRIAKNEAILTAGSSEDEAALTAKIESLKARKEEETPVEADAEAKKEEKGVILLEETVTCAECKHEYASTEDKCPKCGCATPVAESEEVVVEAKADKTAAIAKVETVIANITDLLNIGQEAQANGEQPPVGFEGAQEQLRKVLITLDTMKGKVETKVAESDEVIAEADILVETPTTDEATAELEYLKSLSGM